MRHRGLLVVLSGPAGSGKSTLADALLAADPDICRSTTATTRLPRSGEVNGRDYFFLTPEEFKKGLSEGRFAEYNEFNGNLYGTPRDVLNDLLSRDKVVLLVIDVNGSGQIRRSFPNAAHVFILPPDRDALRKRLSGRGTETSADIERRLTIAEEEIKRIDTYDYLVINDTQEKAVRDLLSILRLARLHHIRGGEREAWLAGAYKDWHARET